MRTFIIVLTFFVVSSSFAQKNGTKFFFKEVGWTIILPNGFVFDSAFSAKMKEDGLKVLEKTNNVKSDTTEETKLLFSVIKNKWNNINSSITSFDSSKQGNYKSYHQKLNSYIYKGWLDGIPDAKLDSSSSVVIIAGLTFDKFHATVFKKDKLLFDADFLSKLYNGYDFTIDYIYLDAQTKNEIEKMLGNSKFLK